MQMKKSLGNMIIFFLILLTSLDAQQLARYKLTTNKQEATLYEPLLIHFNAIQMDHSNVMFFFLHPKKSDDYTIALLSKHIEDKGYHDTKALFTYIVFPLRPKKIEIAFDFVVKTASDAGVANAYVEDHDDSVGIDLHATHLPVKPLTLNIKPLQHPVDLVGDFHLESSIDTQQITPYQNVNLRYTLVGVGYKLPKEMLPPLHDVDIFRASHLKQQPIVWIQTDI